MSREPTQQNRETGRRRREEARTLESLVADIEQDIPGVEYQVETDSIGAEAGMWLHSNWDRRAIPRDSVEWALARFHMGGPYSPVRATYESAKSAGRLGLIRPAALQHAIVFLHERQQPHVTKVNALRIEMGLELWTALGPYEEFGSDFSAAVVPNVSLAVTWEEVQADRALRSAIVRTSSFRRLNAQQMRLYSRQAVEVRDSINAELARR